MSGSPTKSDSLRVGVVGLGIGRAHIQGYLSHPLAHVVAIADRDAGRLESVGDEFSISGRYTSLEEMLAAEKLDILSVCTPNAFHKDMALAAFNAGCHVLCEKPMAMNAGEGRLMLDAARKAGKRLMIDFSYRFNEQSQALKRQVDSGILGDVYFARSVWHRRRGIPGFGSAPAFGESAAPGSWFARKELSGGGPLIDLGVHRLDLALWLMGYPEPEWVMGAAYDSLGKTIAAAEGREFSVEDLAAGFIRFKNGACLEVEASWAANIAENELMETRLLGTKAGLVQRNIDQGYQFKASLHLEREGCQFDMELHPPVPACTGAMYHFIDSILRGLPHDAGGEEGLLVMRLLDALYASAAQAKPIHIG